MPSESKWRTRNRSHPVPIAIITIAFFIWDFDSATVQVHWDGFGKYLNYAFRYTAIACDVLYVIGYFRKKWINLMRPILYVLLFGVVFAGIMAFCFCLGWDMTGGKLYERNSYNGTQVEDLITSTTIVPDIEASTTEGTTEASTTESTSATQATVFPPVYQLCIMRCIFCLFMWVFHRGHYTEKLDKIKQQENDESDNNMVPKMTTSC